MGAVEDQVVICSGIDCGRFSVRHSGVFFAEHAAGTFCRTIEGQIGISGESLQSIEGRDTSHSDCGILNGTLTIQCQSSVVPGEDLISIIGDCARISGPGCSESSCSGDVAVEDQSSLTAHGSVDLSRTIDSEFLAENVSSVDFEIAVGSTVDISSCVVGDLASVSSGNGPGTFSVSVGSTFEINGDTIADSLYAGQRGGSADGQVFGDRMCVDNSQITVGSAVNISSCGIDDGTGRGIEYCITVSRTGEVE